MEKHDATLIEHCAAFDRLDAAAAEDYWKDPPLEQWHAQWDDDLSELVDKLCCSRARTRAGAESDADCAGSV